MGCLLSSLLLLCAFASAAAWGIEPKDLGARCERLGLDQDFQKEYTKWQERSSTRKERCYLEESDLDDLYSFIVKTLKLITSSPCPTELEEEGYSLFMDLFRGFEFDAGLREHKRKELWYKTINHFGLSGAPARTPP